MQKTGQCPKCKSTEVYTNADGSKQGERSFILISLFKNVRVNSCICLNCGYVEEYVEQESMQNQSKMDKIRKNWKKITGHS